MTLAIGITTYNRHSMLMDLIGDIKRFGAGHDLNIVVLDDGSHKSGFDMFRTGREMGFTYLYQGNGGRRRYWRTMQKLYDQFKQAEFDYFYFFPDDFRLAPDYFNRSIEYWNLVDDDKMIGLNTMNTHRVNPGWTNFYPVDVDFGGVTFTRTQWLDCHVMARRNYFEALNWAVPSAKNWRYGSSGVGAMISKKLHSLGYTMYCCPNLIGHGDHESVMHYEERRSNPLIAKI